MSTYLYGAFGCMLLSCHVRVSERIHTYKPLINTLLVTSIMMIKLSHYVMLPKTSAYVKGYDGETKWMYFLIEDDVLLEKYNTIWNKVNADIKKEFDSEPVYNKKFLVVMKLQIFMIDISKVDSNHTYLAVISLDSALKEAENYYPQVFLQECKYKKKLIKDITQDIDIFSSDSEEE